jgi:DNA-binding response OmpR family regulator
MGTAAYSEHPAARRIAGKRILVAEDESDIRKMLRIVLEAVGAIVSEACSATEVLEVLRGSTIDLLVLDWHLGGLSGDRVLSDIAGWKPPFEGRVLVVSGDQRVTGTIAPASTKVSVLIKPFRPVDLVAAIGSLLADAN